MNNLKEHYKKNVIPKLIETFQYKNVHQIPKIEKIHINAGLGLNAQNRVFEVLAMFIKLPPAS
jgi:large subunit ribosomal protein L5